MNVTTRKGRRLAQKLKGRERRNKGVGGGEILSRGQPRDGGTKPSVSPPSNLCPPTYPLRLTHRPTLPVLAEIFKTTQAPSRPKRLRGPSTTSFTALHHGSLQLPPPPNSSQQPLLLLHPSQLFQPSKPALECSLPSSATSPRPPLSFPISIPTHSTLPNHLSNPTHIPLAFPCFAS